ncbi:unnamed protein product [Peronospora destructor]|uniref:PLD phosphodiesterase domain-containing protein n=1 Tax=Peronospora destructor TaxID=86335 RepID=A0AAV0T4W0_9STRA|nr:unnamed protein product [Peronospora destructor]
MSFFVLCSIKRDIAGRIKAIKNARDAEPAARDSGRASPVGDVVYSGYEKYLHEMVLPLKKKYPNKLKVYTTKRELDIYIHSKIVNIDDVYLSIGFVNWNRRSMTSDSELDAIVVDEDTIKSPDRITVNKLARDFRQFDIAAADDMSLLQTLLPKTSLYHIVFLDFVRKQVDPQDCDTT